MNKCNVSAKMQPRMSYHRVTLVLSLLIAAGQWQSTMSMSMSMPLQIIQVDSDEAFQTRSNSSGVGTPANKLALHVPSPVRQKSFLSSAERHDALLQRSARVSRRTKYDPHNSE